MVLESSLAQHATQFTDSLNVRPAPAVEKTADEQAQATKIPEQHGDMVSISKEARALAAPEKSGDSGIAKEEAEEDQNQTIQLLKAQIEKLEEDLKDLEKSDLPEKQKITQVQDKQTQLMELRSQLLKAQQAELKADGYSSSGGTRANGAGNSVADF